MGIRLIRFATSLLASERGVTAIEYGLIAALIAVTIITALNLVGAEIQTTFDTWSSAVSNAVQNSQK